MQSRSHENLSRREELEPIADRNTSLKILSPSNDKIETAGTPVPIRGKEHNEHIHSALAAQTSRVMTY